MARSRKQAYFKDSSGRPYRKWAKRQASKRVRRYTGHIPNGNAYKQLYCSWNISDWVYDCRWEENEWQWKPSEHDPRYHWRKDRYYVYT